MPQLILELSSNIQAQEKNNIQSLFQHCHSTLTKMLPTELDGCKSRSIEYDKYWIGDGHVNNAFVHVTLKVLPGRSPDTLKEVGDSLMGLLKIYFTKSLKKLNLQITIEIVELQKYFKITS